MLRKIPALFLVLLLAGCGDNLKRSSVAHVSSDKNHGFVIQVDFAYRSFGGPCNFPQKPQTISESNWIFTKTTNGVVSADQLILWHGRSPDDEYGWAAQALLGSMTFSNGHIYIDFQEPVYGDNDSILHHDPYRMNGDYKLEGR
ncbi:MAG: hypothetical protein JWQ04_1651 [Pedosphaera sp.]|nr:hypothetical protein [Pedosphaera sp.]